MREGRASFTARAVSAARGIAGVDPVAADLVDGALGWLLRASSHRAARAAVNFGTLGLVDHAELRTRAIDAVVRDAVEAGIRQLVVLGAGLDARAWRMPELADALVFEVDHPSTQAYKRARIEASRPRAREVRFVAIDFERDDLGDVLASAGHDDAAPTLWLWEGVTPYLGIDAMRATLACLVRRSAPDSRLAVTYATPEASSRGPALVRVALVGFRAIGEPLRGLIRPAAMRAELERAGLRVVDDTDPQDWAASFGGARERVFAVDEHLAVAFK
jgi:methyltransferase (TIGR00027 family)